jgi:hypothetical protein
MEALVNKRKELAAKTANIRQKSREASKNTKEKKENEFTERVSSKIMETLTGILGERGIVTTLEEIQKEQATLKGQIEGLATTINESLTLQRLEELRATVTNVESNVEAIMTNTTTSGTSISQLHTQLQKFALAVGDKPLLSEIEAISSKTTVIESDMTSLKTAITKSADSITNLETQLKKVALAVGEKPLFLEISGLSSKASKTESEVKLIKEDTTNSAFTIAQLPSILSKVTLAVGEKPLLPEIEALSQSIASIESDVKSLRPAEQLATAEELKQLEVKLREMASEGELVEVKSRIQSILAALDIQESSNVFTRTNDAISGIGSELQTLKSVEKMATYQQLEDHKANVFSKIDDIISGINSELGTLKPMEKIATSQELQSLEEKLNSVKDKTQSLIDNSVPTHTLDSRLNELTQQFNKLATKEGAREYADDIKAAVKDQTKDLATSNELKELSLEVGTSSGSTGLFGSFDKLATSTALNDAESRIQGTINLCTKDLLPSAVGDLIKKDLEKLSTSTQMNEAVETVRHFLNALLSPLATISSIEQLQETLRSSLSDNTKDLVTLQQTRDQKNEILELIHEIPTISEVHQMFCHSAKHQCDSIFEWLQQLSENHEQTERNLTKVCTECRDSVLKDNKNMYDALKPMLDDIPTLMTHQNFKKSVELKIAEVKSAGMTKQELEKSFGKLEGVIMKREDLKVYLDNLQSSIINKDDLRRLKNSILQHQQASSQLLMQGIGDTDADALMRHDEIFRYVAIMCNDIERHFFDTIERLAALGQKTESAEEEISIIKCSVITNNGIVERLCRKIEQEVENADGNAILEALKASIRDQIEELFQQSMGHMYASESRFSSEHSSSRPQSKLSDHEDHLNSTSRQRKPNLHASHETKTESSEQFPSTGVEGRKAVKVDRESKSADAPIENVNDEANDSLVAEPNSSLGIAREKNSENSEATHSWKKSADDAHERPQTRESAKPHPKKQRTSTPVARWVEYDIGPMAPKNGKMSQKLSHNLPMWVAQQIHDQDQASATANHRQYSVDQNVGRPRICWLSASQPIKGWEIDGNKVVEPRSRGRKSDTKTTAQMRWWEKVWTDTDKICPKCEHLRTTEKRYICFYFSSITSVRIFKELVEGEEGDNGGANADADEDAIQDRGNEQQIASVY